MKKLVSVILAVLMLAAFSGCGTAEAGGSNAGEIDVDLTQLSSTVVYSQVYDMLVYPENYEGKTVKMTGQFVLYQGTDENGDPIDGQLYYACVIQDATACCQQGMEFVLKNATYPDDYPELGSDITVVGEFETYMEGTQQYCHLTNATLAEE